MKMRVRRRRRLPLRILLILFAVGALALFELYHFVMPFVARNPLYHEVTIGESVIGDWRYEGEDEEGYLRFANKPLEENVTLPPTSKLFGADGKFVVIENYEPGSLTFAEPLQSAPPIWYVIMVGVVGASLWFFIFRIKSRRKHRMQMRNSSKMKFPLEHMPKVSRGRRFRASKQQRTRFFR